MPRTLTYANVISIISKNLPRAVENHFASVIANLATDLIWYAYDWRESLAELPPFYLIPKEQDHGPPLVQVPADFHGFRKTELLHIPENATEPTVYKLAPMKNLEITHLCSIPHAISYNAETRSFRLFPRVPENMAAPQWQVVGSYKKRPALITNSTLETLLPFDDMYLPVWLAAARWAALEASGSPEAGQFQSNGAFFIPTGALSKALGAIDLMAKQEGLQDGDDHIHPDGSLVSPTSGVPEWPTGRF